MKQLWLRMGMVLVVLLMLLCIAGCNQENVPPETEHTETTQVSLQQALAERYTAAVEALPKDTLGLQIDYTRDVTVGGQTYGEAGSIRLEYWNIASDSFLAQVRQEISYDEEYAVEISEVYSAGKLYQTVGEDKFRAELTEEDFLSRYVPLQMLDTALYTLSADDTGSRIIFANAVAGEAWLMPATAELTSASATAQLSAVGQLLGTTYSLEYTYGPARIAVSYDVTVEAAGTQPAVPEDPAEYVRLADPEAIYVMEHAYGYLLQTQQFTSNSNTLIVSAAGGCAVQNICAVDTYPRDNQCDMRWQTNYTFVDYTTGETVNQKLVEKFVKGKYTVSMDGGAEEPNKAVTWSQVETAVDNHLLSCILDNQYVASVEFTNLGSVLLWEYTGTETLGEAFCRQICTQLYQDAELLNELASSYETKKVQFYLALDKYTLLPTAVGMEYEGAHVIEGQSYALTQQVGQSFDLASITSYDTIYEEASDPQPETPAKPLFYHVTGADGQEMWLLGTIHVGDARTAYLPEAIYTAFRGSDALAIECDTDAFAAQVETDPTLAAQVSECYFYSDGSQTADHFATSWLYEDAVRMLKATGNYNADTTMEKLHLWSSYLDQFHLRQGHALTSEKGVEQRLLALAKAESIPVRQIESALAQLQMMDGYSDHLQELMLYSAMASGSVDGWRASVDLYELWCAGDETALTQALTEEVWQIREEDIILDGLTGEELERAQAVLKDLDSINQQLAQLQQEYNKAMLLDRNAGMLEAAKEYLESGETVFYAVGLAHLLGEDGLVKGLRDAGYTVEVVTYE